VNEGEAAMMWLPLPDATSYDAVRGDLAALANSGGDFSLATGACLGADLNVTSLADVDDPPPDTGFWYLVRPANCAGRGSYDSAGSGQVASRDAGIAASASACPE
jgi:hypothetical protein